MWVAAGHEYTALAATEILKANGNAVDAAVAALFAAFVCEPCMTSAGGGGVAQIRSPHGEVITLDFFCHTPSKKRPVDQLCFEPATIDFGTEQEIYMVGQGAVAVPGTIAGLFSMHERWGSIPMSELVQPAIQLAKEGVRINNFQFLDFKLLASIVGRSALGRSLYFPDDEFIQVGQVMKMTRFADFLEVLAKEGRSLFYQGEIAQQIAKDQSENGGNLSRVDFENYQVKYRKPLAFPFTEYRVFTNPVPGRGGVMLQDAVENWSANTDSSPFGMNHVLAMTDLLKQLHIKYHENGQAIIQPYANKKWGSTTHFSILGDQGFAVALTSTNGEGSGCFVNGADIQLNNMLGESALLPGGYHSWTPNTRMSTMMSPTIVQRDDSSKELVSVLGTGGASRIPTVIFQALLNLLVYKIPVDKALTAPRLHFQGGKINIEDYQQLDLELGKLTEDCKLWNELSMFFGGVNTIHLQGNDYAAFGDSRRDGVAIQS